jgi:REP-associated tyrosine transposase
MPRPPRLHIPGAHYHVMLRGNHHEALFEQASDRQRLNDIVSEVLAITRARVHAFCWMTNHLHALVQIFDQPLGKTMQRIAVRYSRHRHRALQTRGHLFERRYKAKLVDVDEYFLALVRYIHLNPVKAQIVCDPAHYPWSSHQAYLGLVNLPWLTTDFAFSLFSTRVIEARAAYRTFMCAEADRNFDLDMESHPKDSRILGSDRFIESLPVIPIRPRSTLTLDQLADQICSALRITASELRSPSRARHLSAVRARFARSAIDLRICTLAEVARFLHRDPSALTKLLARHSKQLRADR